MASKAIGFLNFKFGADLSGFQRALKKAQKGLKKFGKWAKQTGQTLSRNLTLPILALGVASIKAFDAQQKAIAQVEAGLKSTGNMVGFTSKQLQEMAAELQKISLFGDEDILQNVTAQLLTFTNIAQEQFEKTQVVAMDLATRVFDGNLKSASLMLGKALNDPVANLSALSRAGIQFSEDQKILIKSLAETGRLAEAQNVILAELEVQYGGSAEAARKAGLGPIEALQNQLSDLSEQIGERLVPYVEKLTKFIVGLAEKFDGLSESQKDNIVKWGLIVAAIGPVLIIFGTLSLAFAAIATPIGLITIAIGTLTTAFIYLKTSTSNIARKIRNTFKFMANNIISDINNIILAYNSVSSFVNANPISLITYYEFEEKPSSSGSLFVWERFHKKLKKRLEKVKKTADLGKNKIEESEEIKALKAKIALLEKELKKRKELVVETEKYSKALDPLIEKIKEYADVSTKMWQDGGILEGPEHMLNWTEKLTKAQEAHNATVVLLEDIMFSAAMSAANSQQKFFDSFIENIKKAIKQLLIQLAVLTVIALLLGGPTMTLGKAFTIAKGKILGLEGFADGGLVYGPTTALIGEGVGTTASNPEVVAPLDKLKQYMGGGNQNIIVEGVLKGNDIYLSNKNTSVNRLRTT